MAKNKKLKTVVSLFDGISCARIALEKAGFSVGRYYSSEVDKYAMQIAQRNYPDTIQLGDVRIINTPMLLVQGVDLLIGGSPCQDLSIAKKDRKGLEGARSNLFWEYVRILKEVKPKYFILENVASMPQEAKDVITKTLGVEPIMINAALVSAQNRKRLFWTNIPGVKLPEDRGILLQDILDLEEGSVPERQKSNTIRTGGRGSGHGDKHNWDTIKVLQYRRSHWRESKQDGKSPTLTANMGTGGHNVPFIEQVGRGKNKGGKKALDGKTPTVTSSSFEHNNKLVIGENVRKLSVVECERLQSLPDNYTEGVSNAQRYKAIGNAFNVDVVAHILSFIK